MPIAQRLSILVLVFCILLEATQGNLAPVIANPAQESSGEAAYAGQTLAKVQVNLDSQNSVVRRRAALNLLPFALNKASGWEQSLVHALDHQDPAVVYWACEVAAKVDQPGDPIKRKIAELAADPNNDGRKLAAAYADFMLNENLASLEYLMQVIEQPCSGKTFVDTKHMASVLTAADFIAQIGARRLGPQLPLLIERLETHSQRVVKLLGEKQVHGQMYHAQKACDRTVRLLRDPDFESSAPLEPLVADGLAAEVQVELPATSGLGDDPWPGMQRPNILWISCEDISPNLGCYGDPLASTPNLDQLASQGILFRNAFTHAGVCAVLRSGVITGRYPISIGTQHMRSFRPTLADSPCFPELMREAGYFCTNRSKTDYQFQHSPKTWDREGSRHRDWRERRDPEQPFFSVINFTISHESQVRHRREKHRNILAKLSADQKHDPAEVQLPPYLPDDPRVRQDLAWYHDNISEMDRQVGEVLERLEDDGLTESTVVVFWSDHGQGLPRGKRWLYDSGTHVPMIVRFPDQYAAATQRQDLVTLLDLAPTMLSLAEVKVPANMDGRILWGKDRQPPPAALFFHRDRMDETYDLIRSMRNSRFRYIRNYQPLRTYNQYLEYLELMPTMQVWRSRHHQGKLAPDAEQWFHSKPFEELYDVVRDPHQVRNLAADPAYHAVLNAMRASTHKWQEEVGDTGMTPEVIMLDELWPE